MILLLDPYAHRHWSMAEVRLINRLADALVETHEDLDLSALTRTIQSVYRPGMQAQALLMHVARALKLSN